MKLTKPRSIATTVFILLFAGLAPAPAAAHPMPGVGDFYAGMLHPITTVEFVLPLVALSLLAGQQARTSAIAMLITVPVSLFVGAVVGLLAPVPTAVSSVNLAAMTAVGLIVATGCPLPSVVATGLSVMPAAAVGWANGAEINGQMSALRFIAGLVLVGFLLIAYGIGAARRLQAPWMRVGFRVLGSWIAAIGLLVQSLK
jgi:urease accessory protein